MAEGAQEAARLMQEAEKKSRGGRGGGFLGMFGGGGAKVDEAVELYQRAANLFKMDKVWGSAGKAFVAAAELILTEKDASKHTAAQCYVDASTCFRKVDPNEAINCLSKAVDIHTAMGKFSIAAKHHMSIAELFESDPLNDKAKAIPHYEKAADFYLGEESQSHANKCLLKVAEFSAECKDYDKAAKIYEQIGLKVSENQLLRHSARDYFFKALLCRLCIDYIGCMAAMKRYVDQYPAFQDSREYKLINDLVQSMEESNIDGFTAAVQEYDKISRFDPWTTKLLLEAKRGLGETDFT